ncbi:MULTISPECIES: hypothetical protein [unclassified Brevibacterium]|uniref:hypothetical protein n=1 Tax=unclassified Brevibacterium TaxID=2614124 RepID=UPI001E507F69|nr:MULTISPECIES: hypothetical protein [unclassified Brevibacterium]MCD1286020.1 hypothetical protein [Brevibacterium sp. CCUG 69071]MDK8433371.1 hypothetical protein [Brevibacterium sp. H-BE7]
MTTAYRHRKVLSYSALVVVALGLPTLVPFSATLLGWVMHLPMRLSLDESLLATIGVFAAWFVVSRLIDVILDSSDLGATLTGRAVSAFASMAVLGGGYLLIVDSVVLSLLMAGVVCGLFFALSTMIDRSAQRTRGT